MESDWNECDLTGRDEAMGRSSLSGWSVGGKVQRRGEERRAMAMRRNEKGEELDERTTDGGMKGVEERAGRRAGVCVCEWCDRSRHEFRIEGVFREREEARDGDTEAR